METSSQNSSQNDSNGESNLKQSIQSISGRDDGRPLGAPIQIVKVSEERRLELNLDALSKILLRDSIRDKPVVVVSIAGDFRKGMSRLLSYKRLTDFVVVFGVDPKASLCQTSSSDTCSRVVAQPVTGWVTHKSH